MPIPRVFFQTWETKDIPQNLYDLTIGSWRLHNPGYEHRLYDAQERLHFLKTYFDEDTIDTYNDIRPGALKADFWRYCVLYIHGGVYADLDTACFSNLDEFLKEREFVTIIDLNTNPYEGKHNLFNSFIAAVPGHPILKGCIERIKKQVLFNELPASRLDWTGPGVLGRETNLYLGRDETEGFVGLEGQHAEGRLCLLHFEPNSEFVTHNGKVLLQNKNGCGELSRLYEMEVRRLNLIQWTRVAKPW
jgi:hypothetical protein